MKKAIFIIMITVFLNVALTKTVQAHGQTMYRAVHHPNNARHRYTPFVPPKPPGWPQILFAKDIIKSFREKGWITVNTSDVRTSELKTLPGRTWESVGFIVPFYNTALKGCVLSFKEKKEFEKIKKYYLDLNKKGKLYSWSFSRDNILVVLDGAMPARMADEFQSILNQVRAQHTH
jgi:hypothetical protein